MRVLAAHAREHRRVLLVCLLLALVGSAAGLAQPLAAGSVIDALGIGAGMLEPVAALGALVLASAVANGANAYLMARTGERVVLAVRRGLAGRLVRLRVAELDEHPPGDLISRATSDTSWIRAAATAAPVQLVNGTIGLLGALALMAFLDLLLFGVTLAVLMIAAIVVLWVLPGIRAATQRAQASVGLVGSALDRALGSNRTVKAAGAEAREEELIGQASEEAYRAGLVGARLGAALVVVAELATQVSFLVVLGFGGSLVAAGQMPVSTLVAFLLYLFYLMSPLSELVLATTTLQQGLGAAQRLAEIDELAVEDGVDEPDTAGATTSDPAPDPHLPPALHIAGVRFGYPGRDHVLHDVDFQVPAGHRVALVGPSGAGKSTLLALLLRFHDPHAGSISLDGRDVATMSRAELRRRIGLVEQDCPALDGTLAENLRYAAPGATDAELDDVLRRTELSPLVARLPDGIETEVGPRGVTLSGGERQRLAIARALLRRPGLLLLDEATAHLDARTEEAMRALLAAEPGRRTVLVIAHRLATVRDADAIVVLDRGRVRACGPHDELMRVDDLYRELATTQLEGGHRARRPSLLTR